jgi:hypothetical protein
MLRRIFVSLELHKLRIKPHLLASDGKDARKYYLLRCIVAAEVVLVGLVVEDCGNRML